MAGASGFDGLWGFRGVGVPRFQSLRVLLECELG